MKNHFSKTPWHLIFLQLRIFSFLKLHRFLEKLESFGIVRFGHFEYKGKAIDGSHLHGEIFVDFRQLTTDQEIELSEYYREAITEWFEGKENLLIVGVAMGSLMLPKSFKCRSMRTRALNMPIQKSETGAWYL